MRASFMSKAWVVPFVMVLAVIAVLAVTVTDKPRNEAYELDGAVELYCNVTPNGNYNVTNVSVYHNATGAWGKNDSKTSNNATGTFVQVHFDYTGFSDGNVLLWNCWSKQVYKGTIVNYTITALSGQNVTINTSLSDLHSCVVYNTTNIVPSANYTIYSSDYATFDLKIDNASKGFNNSLVNISCEWNMSIEGFGENKTVYFQTAPSVVVNAPATNKFSNTSEVLFNVTVTSLSTSETSFACHLFRNSSTYSYSWDGVTHVCTNATDCTWYQAFIEDNAVNWAVKCSEYSNSNIINSTANRTLGVDLESPIVYKNTSSTVYDQQDMAISFYVHDKNPDTCIVYTNASGTWGANGTFRTLTNGTVVIANYSVANGTYSWDVWCNDSAKSYAWGGSNYSYTIDDDDPSFTDPSFVVNTTNNCTQIKVQIYADEDVNVSFTYRKALDNTGNHTEINSTFSTLHGMMISDFTEETDYNTSTIITDRAGNSATYITSSGSYGVFTPLKVCSGWKYYSILQSSSLNLTGIADKATSDYVYVWNQTGKAWLYVASGVGTRDYVPSYGEPVFLYNDANDSVWFRPNSTTTDSYTRNFTATGDAFLGLVRQFNYTNLSNTFNRGVFENQTNKTYVAFAGFNNTRGSWDSGHYFNTSWRANVTLGRQKSIEVAWVWVVYNTTEWNNTDARLY